MPNPKLEPGTWYRTAVSLQMTKARSDRGEPIVTVPKNSLVMFVEYHPGSIRSCKVMFREYVGWLKVPNKYKDHTFFFQKASK